MKKTREEKFLDEGWIWRKRRKRKRGTSENGSFRNTTHSGKCHNAFHGAKNLACVTRYRLSVGELSIDGRMEQNRKEKKKEKQKEKERRKKLLCFLPPF